jgi:phage terminase large subunit
MHKHSRTYYDITTDFLPSGKRIAVNQGGTRSGKTYSILQFLIETAIRSHIAKMQGRIVTICRKTLPALKATAMRDFIQILESINMYSEQMHNKSVGEYHLHETTFEFISLDQPQKVRGRKRDVLFINEANELTYEDWRQLLLRTTDKILIDYNPSDEYHWIYDNVCTRDDVKFYRTTYRDNPYLNETQIQEIERLQQEDLNYWKIYGLGERGVSGATIYTNWEETDKKDVQGETAYGLDFGFNNPTALVKCVRTDAGMYAEQLLYQSHLTNNDLIQALKGLVSTRNIIYCDSAEPDRIAELSRAGFNVRPAKKEVKVGIDKCKSVRIYAHGHELVKEIRNYKWKIDTNEKAIDEPVKVNDHLMDAMRYGAYNLIAERNIKAPKTTLI